MRDNERDTPPSSLNGDEITSMEEDGFIYLDEMEELQFDDEDAELDDAIETDTEVEDHAKLVYTKHMGSVFCCDLHPNGKLAVTGGEDDRAYVWSTENGHTVLECKGHKDSVVFVGFSFDGAFVASADMSGVIKVWKCILEDNQTPWPMVFEYEANELTWGQWHFGARVLMCGTMTGEIYVFKIPSGDTKVLKTNNMRTDCAKLFKDGTHLAVGYEDGGIKVWDLKLNSVVQNVPSDAHQMNIQGIDISPDGNIMASVSIDGNVCLITTGNGKVVKQIKVVDSDLEALAFAPNPQLGYLALGTLNGEVSTWDVCKQMMRHQCAVRDDIAGVTKMIWINDHLVTACLDGTVRLYNGRCGDLLQVITGHKAEVLDLCYNEKENIILTTSDDYTARIFNYVNNENDSVI